MSYRGRGRGRGQQQPFSSQYRSRSFFRGRGRGGRSGGPSDFFDSQRISPDQYHTPPPPSSSSSSASLNSTNRGGGRDYNNRCYPPPPPRKFDRNYHHHQSTPPRPPSDNEDVKKVVKCQELSSKPENERFKIPLTEAESEIMDEIRKEKLDRLDGRNPTQLKKDEDLFFDIFSKFLTYNSPNPFRSALAFCLNSRDFRLLKQKTFTQRVLLSFERWLKIAEGKGITKEVNKETQIDCFSGFLHCGNSTLMKKAFRLFKLHEIPEEFEEKIGQMIQSKDYKRAFEVLDALGMLDSYPDVLDVLVIPLIIGGRAGVVEEIITDHPRLQKEVLGFLDDLYEDGINKISALCRVHTYDRGAVQVLSGKALGKMIQRYISKYGLSLDLAPKHSRQKIINQFRYLIHQKDSENMIMDNWRDLVEESLKTNPEMIDMFIDMLLYDRCVADVDELVFWAKKLSLREDQLPPDVWRRVQGQEAAPNQTEIEEEYWDDDEVETNEKQQHQQQQQELNNTNSSNSDSSPNKYYPLNLPKEQLIFIDNFTDFRDKFLPIFEGKLFQISGYDSEFRPNSTADSKETAAIIQIAVQTAVFILDMNTLAPQAFDLLLEHYFMNSNLTVLGYGIAGDLRVLSNTHPVFLNIQEKCKCNVIDLDGFTRRLTQKVPHFVYPHHSEAKGLCGLTERVFGLPLDKRNQISNWDKRPLKTSQLEYAALDAFVLLELYQDILNLTAFAVGGGESVDLLIRDVMKELKADRIKTVKEVRKKKIPPGPYKNTADKPVDFKPITVKEFKVICDKMLMGLSKKLRAYGVDALALEDFETEQVLIDKAQSEKRIILTKGRNKDRYKQYVPSGHCFSPIADKPEEQIDEIFKHFKVTLNEDLLFSRCTLCNGSHFVTLPQTLMISLREGSVVHGPPPLKEEEDDFDDDFENGDEEEDFDEDYLMASQAVANDIWIKLDDDIEIHKSKLETKDGVKFKLLDVPQEVVIKQHEFFVCDNCGHVYWEGTHWNRTREKMSKLSIKKKSH